MTKRKMFLRMITASLVRRRSRMLVALLAIAVGATILSGLVTIYYDVPRQMGAQFRNYGANMIFLAASNEARFDLDTVRRGVACIDAEELVGVAPYRYETVRIHEQPILAAGTDLDGAKATSPYWHIDGEWPSARYEVLVGQETAEFLGLKTGDVFNATWSSGEEEEDVLNLGVDMKVAGILETGGSEEEYLYMSLSDMEELAGETEKLDVVELSVSASADELKAYEQDIEANVPDIAPRLVKRVTESESTVLTKLQSLVFLVTAVVLVLTMICVATTMTAVVTERRKEIGLRKSLGASDGSIIWEFMGEGLLLGGVGGILGSILGFAFAQFVSVHVFSSSITYQPALLPVTILVSVLVTGLACLLPVRSATEVDPALVLKGE
ncbi:MAG: ABC transporter permease [Oscillospiraceae bacterium]|nr:ABC transporter permease [Oscillospiraceae bacterium]